MAVSSDVAWAVVRNNSAFLLKKRGCPKPFNTDPLNLTNKNAKRYCGLVNPKAVGISLMTLKNNQLPNKPAYVLSVKNPSSAFKPAKNVSTFKINTKADRSRVSKVRSLVSKTVRKDLTKAALRRLCAVLRGQKTLKLKNKASTKTTKVSKKTTK